MNHNSGARLRQSKDAQNGYTLVEAIIAIAICGFSLAVILGLYGMVIKTEMVSKNIFAQSVEINSISDEINGCLSDANTLNISEKVTVMLQNKYPDYYLEEISRDVESNLYLVKILHKGKNSLDQAFYIKVFWRSV